MHLAQESPSPARRVAEHNGEGRISLEHSMGLTGQARVGRDLNDGIRFDSCVPEISWRRFLVYRGCINWFHSAGLLVDTLDTLRRLYWPRLTAANHRTPSSDYLWNIGFYDPTSNWDNTVLGEKSVGFTYRNMMSKSLEYGCGCSAAGGFSGEATGTTQTTGSS